LSCALDVRREREIVVVRDCHGVYAPGDALGDKGYRADFPRGFVCQHAARDVAWSDPSQVTRRVALKICLVPNSHWVLSFWIWHMSLAREIVPIVRCSLVSCTQPAFRGRDIN